jgi:acetyl esterase/lipase
MPGMPSFNRTLFALLLIVQTPVVAAPAPSRDKFHLYLLAGQSNMAGRGAVEEQDRTPHPRVFTLNADGQWVQATEPLHFDKPKVAGVGPGLAFARVMAEASPDVTIGLIPCAVGGTPISSWQPGKTDPATKTTPYDTAIARAKRARQDGTLKGLLWHQGESDATEQLAPKYGNILEFTLSRFRDDLGVDDLPIVVGELAPFKLKDDPHAQRVNTELKYCPARLAYCASVSADGLTHKGDNLHLDSASARGLGKRYATAMLELQSRPRPTIVKVWPEGLPDGKPLDKPEEKKNARVARVSDPTLMIYLPPKEKATGAAVVICPGGGYNILAIEKEGDTVARWLNSLGVAAFVLKYRLKDYPQPAPLRDAQQAVRIVRDRAREWSIDANRVGVIGFSAGGHLAASASNSAPLPLAADGPYARFNPINPRPDFSILIYGVLPQPGDKWVKDMYTPIIVSKESPPAFLAHARDDNIPAQLSIDYAQSLHDHGVAHELQLFDKGGHGYGLGQSVGEAATWPERCAKWMEARGLLKRTNARANYPGSFNSLGPTITTVNGPGGFFFKNAFTPSSVTPSMAALISSSVRMRPRMK